MDGLKSINQKLESFMKRNFPKSEYQRIRCYERCIVDKSIKLALITSKTLLITDSPPRTIYYTLPLIDVLSLTMVQDLPDFLPKEERLKCQHISLKFKNDSGVCKIVENSLNESTSSYVSTSSEGDTSVEKSPSSLSKSMASLSRSRSASTLSATSWQSTLLTPRGQSLTRLDSSLLSDSGSSMSSVSQSSSSDSSLDLFLLTDSNLFFQLLQAASLNEKIAWTKQLTFKVNGISKTKRKKSVLRCQLYSQLSGEILLSQSSLEGRFGLVLELKIAAQNDPAIKKYFWKDVDLFKVLVDDLGAYRTGTSRNNRADEIEYLILLESCVSEMFRESEHLSHRASLLTTTSWVLLRDLLDNLTSEPNLSTYLRNSPEMEELCSELLESTVTLLFEVLLAAAEHPTFGTDLSLSRVIGLLEHNFNNFGVLFSKLVDRGMSLISRTITPRGTLPLYCVFYVLEVVSRYSPLCGALLRNNHQEDVRYYCSSPEVKLARYSPLQAPTIERISRLLEQVS